MLQKKRRHVDTTDLMVEINGILKVTPHNPPSAPPGKFVP